MRQKIRPWIFLGCLLLCRSPLVVELYGQESVPLVRGWTAGIAADRFRRTEMIGARLGYWGNSLGFDGRMQLSFFGLEDTSDNNTFDEQVSAMMGLGVKAGFPTGSARWFGRVGAGLEIEESLEHGENGDSDTATFILGFFEVGSGVDLAVSDRLVLGLTLLNLRVLGGEYDTSGIEAIDLGGGQLSLLTGGHLSYQF
ncbi:hypothetical protein AU468_09310 [Alkalispirochaeta sphaeroplastigenens]|uniref:Outer membrane protein beta-barrel domain-containing protein n=1 Tax=Alkalispirochaeta sphaeroplastigenens TaxID=1187066 RepID=A0A2S4JMT3_9SPIO|nr:hypothetical protein [Alkalispirochaeta sphaeroplastigenens]POR00836.1 hypothetical protein AU468_09310 [Alkalispirochaeta sphaeroplastigenens]